jgi:transketolase
VNRAPGAGELTDYLRSARAGHAEKSIRAQFGETLLSLGDERSDFLVLTSDLMYATGIEQFGEKFPHRVFNLGIAEQCMAGVAAGLALCGRLPIVSGYAAFTSLRGIEQVKLDAAYNGVKVIFAGQSAGLSYGVGGPTHQTYEDVAIMRAIPGLTVLVPSDAHEADSCLRAAVEAELSSPIYVRLGRGPEFLFNAPGLPFRIGEVVELRSGSDVALFANGSMVCEALLATDYLATLGVRARLLNVHTVKPLDRGAIREAMAGVTGALVVEEHSILGGLASAILECIADRPSCPLVRLGIPDEFPPIGPPHALRAHLGLSAENIVRTVLTLLGEEDSRQRTRQT